jgi:sulfide:quinone oxidoreductase
MPSIPWIDPAIERSIWWTLKAHGLKPMYFYGMLKGLI